MRLAYLYIEKKQFFLAIALFEQVLQNPEYRQNNNLLKTLSVLYRENLSEEKYVNFLIDVSSDRNLEENFRREFQTKLIFAYYEKNNWAILSTGGKRLKKTNNKSAKSDISHLLNGVCLV